MERMPSASVLMGGAGSSPLPRGLTRRPGLATPGRPMYRSSKMKDPPCFQSTTLPSRDRGSDDGRRRRGGRPPLRGVCKIARPPRCTSPLARPWHCQTATAVPAADREGRVPCTRSAPLKAASRRLWHTDLFVVAHGCGPVLSSARGHGRGPSAGDLRLRMDLQWGAFDLRVARRLCRTVAVPPTAGR